MNTMRIEIFTRDKMFAAIDKLEKMRCNDYYDFIAVDHLDDWCMITDEEVCEELGVQSLGGNDDFGRSWKEYRKALNEMQNRLLRLGPGIVYIAHEVIKKVETRNLTIDRTMPDLPKTAWKVFIPKADFIGYCGYRTVREGGERREIRVLETVPTETLYLKDRTKRDKPSEGFEELDGKQFAATFK